MNDWPAVRLGDVCDVQNGFAFDGTHFSEAAGMPLVRIRDLKTNLPSIHFDGPFHTEYIVRGGDVLIGMDGEFIAYEWGGPDALLNERICRLLPRPDALDPRFLQLAIGSYLRDIEARTSLTTVKHLSSRTIAEIPLPLPPLDEQRRIAARLRQQLAEIGRVDSTAQARIAQMNSLAERAIDSAIPDSDAIALGHTLRTPLRTGLSRAASATANHKVLTLVSVRDGVLDVGQNRPMDATDDEALVNAVRPSTFYIVRGNGSLHMAGAGALSPEWTDRLVLFPDLLIQVDPDPALLSVEYLALAWRSRRVRRQVEARLRTSAGIYKINLANLSAVEVPTLPITEQRRIAARLREQLAEIDCAKAALEAQRAAIDALPAALLREVFGEVIAV